MELLAGFCVGILLNASDEALQGVSGWHVSRRGFGLRLLLRSRRAPSAVERQEADNKSDRAVDRPLRLTCHEAAGEYVDALKEPDCSDKYKYNANEGQCIAH